MSRPAEQLYQTSNDSYEMVDLAGDPEHEKMRVQLSQELDRWMDSQDDPGAKVDLVKSHQAAKSGEHLFGVPHE